MFIFFIEIIEKNELVIYKVYGLTNFKLDLKIISSFLIDVVIIVFFYNLSSNLKFLYLDIKNDYSKDDKYLAVVTGNGLWIRDEIDGKINYINADKLNNNELIQVSISQFNKNFELEKVISSKKAIIKSTKWKLINPIINIDNTSIKKDEIIFKSNFNLDRILNIFENLSSLSLLELEKLKDYELLGYNTAVLDGYKHKIYSYPIYLSLMACIAAILMLNVKHNKPKIVYLALGILISVIIYYINYFFNGIIETKDIPYLISIWGPQLILSMIIITNLININDK